MFNIQLYSRLNRTYIVLIIAYNYASLCLNIIAMLLFLLIMDNFYSLIVGTSDLNFTLTSQ